MRAAARGYTVAVLERLLYEYFYCPGTPIPSAPDDRRAPPRPDARFVSELSSANAGAGSWQDGWRVDGRIGGDLIVSKDGLRVRAKPSEARVADGAAVTGTAAQLRLPKELPFASPGFYMALGETDLLADPVIRLYFHVVAAGAAPLVAAVTPALNGMKIPFRLKVIDAPERFTRCDAAVLYVHNSDFEALRPFLRALPARAGVQLRERTPAFTQPLGRGIGLAEQPAAGASFGEHRCRLLAEGILAAHILGAKRVEQRVEIVEAHFAAAGVDLRAPYLESGSVDRYAL